MQDFVEGDFFLLARHYVCHIRHSHADHIGQALFKRYGGSRPGDNVAARVHHQRRRSNILYMRPNIMTVTGLGKTPVSAKIMFQRAPDFATAEQFVAVGNVIVWPERVNRNQLLKCMKAGFFVYGSQTIELVAQARVGVGPAPHIYHASHQIGSFQCHPLTNTGANTHQTDEIDLVHAEVVEQANNVVRVQLGTRRHAQIIVRLANSTVVNQQHRVLIGHTPREKMLSAMTKCVPATHINGRWPIPVYFVIHVVIINRRAWHSEYSVL